MHVIHVPENLLAYRASGREKVNEEGICRMCREPGEWRPGHLVRKMSRHHLVPQSWFEVHKAVCIRSGFPMLSRVRDCDANIIPICTHCHADVESPHDDGARRMLRKVLAKEEAAFAIAVRGQQWFDARYPASAFAPDRWQSSESLIEDEFHVIPQRESMIHRVNGQTKVAAAFTRADVKRRLRHQPDCQPPRMCIASCEIWQTVGYPCAIDWLPARGGASSP
jgi:hypothetical protein